MPLKVVIVEDEEMIRKGLVLVINWLEMDCTVVGAAKDGLEGLEVIRTQHPDIVLTDIKMPRIDGLKMLETALREQNFYSIVLTSYSEFDLARQAIRAGVTDYLLKPVDEEELKVVVNKIRERVDTERRYQKFKELSQERALTAQDEWGIFDAAGESMDYYVEKTFEFIKNHYQEKLSINEVAESLEVSPSYLSRKLKAKLNITFVDLLNRYRIKQAISLLNQGTMKIYEVSDQLGFSDYKYFCNVFKKYANVSPSEFVKNGGGLITGKKTGKW